MLGQKLNRKGGKAESIFNLASEASELAPWRLSLRFMKSQIHDHQGIVSSCVNSF